MIRTDSFEEMELLLPFYVNGTLNAQDTHLINCALAQSPVLWPRLTENCSISSCLKAGYNALLTGATGIEDQLLGLLCQIEALEQ
jgi:hypothetical protein